MLEFLRPCFAFVRRKTTWLPKIASWQDRLLALGLFLWAACLVWFRQDLSLLFEVVGWACLLITLAVTVRRGWLRFFGPVFFYDIVKTARRSNFALLRGVYAGTFLAVIFLVYYSYVSFGRSNSRTAGYWEVLWSPASVSRDNLARFGNQVVLYFSSVQMIAVLLLTPLCAAGAIAEEKERRTLDFILISELSDREIILGKLAGRMAYLVLFVATGLPILSIIQFLGGVDPNLVLASFIMTLLTMASLAGASVMMSTAVQKTRTAVFLTYLILGGYLLTSSCCLAFPVGWITAGNPFSAAVRLFAPGFGAGTDNVLWVAIEYSMFHIGIILFCFFVAAANLRVRANPEDERAPVVVVQRDPPTVKPFEPALATGGNWGPWEVDTAAVDRYRARFYPQVDPPPKPKPPVGDASILWKELYAEPLIRVGPGGQTIGMIFGIMGLLLAAYVLLLGLAAAASSGNLSGFCNALARYAGTGVACLMLLGIALRAAGTITTERDRQTLDGLLTCPWENRTILLGKWLGSILSVRKGWLLLGPLWGLALVTGGIHPMALPLLLIAWAAYAAFTAGLGLFFSLISRSTLIATLATVIALVGFFGGHRGLWRFFEIAWYPPPAQVPENVAWIGDFLLDGCTPPLTLGILSFRSPDFEPPHVLLTWQMVRYGLIGVGCFGATALLLWGLLLNRFGAVTGRMPLPQATRTLEDH
jgi:ABC-type transport system involved in multi-copper enzyme maturation permease subunit